MTMVYFDEVMARHPRSENDVGEPVCGGCGAFWPCDAWTLAWHWDKEQREQQHKNRRSYVEGCAECERFTGKHAPWHDPSPNCKSGGHEHCACDTCF